MAGPLGEPPSSSSGPGSPANRLRPRSAGRAACPCRVLDRGRRVGGRMAPAPGADRAASSTSSTSAPPTSRCRIPRLAALAADWRSPRAGPGVDRHAPACCTRTGRRARTAPGPMRWAATRGLRSLVEDLGRGSRRGERMRGRAGGRETAPGRRGRRRGGRGGRARDAPAAGGGPALRAGGRTARARAGPGVGSHADVWAGWRERWWNADLEGAFVQGSPRRGPDSGRRPPPGRRRAGARRPQHARVRRAVAGRPRRRRRGRARARSAGCWRGAPSRPLFARARRWSLASPCAPQDRARTPSTTSP